jgi:ribonuclease BN (tRNA processing enzyme)
MKVIFLGVGEAFDETLPNNSHLILSETHLLLDCGYAAPGQVWKYQADQSFIDAIYISHTHADHYFGIPPLLTRMWEEKRKKPLTIISPQGTTATVKELIEFGYRGISDKFEFPVHYREADETQNVIVNELELSFARTEHPAHNHAVKISDGRHSVCYSGDGMFLEKTEHLYRNADLVIHEAYLFDTKIPNHACITDLLQMAVKNNIKCLALTHLQREFRKKEIATLRQRLSKEKVKIIFPQPLAEYIL